MANDDPWSIKREQLSVADTTWKLAKDELTTPDNEGAGQNSSHSAYRIGCCFFAFEPPDRAIGSVKRRALREPSSARDFRAAAQRRR
jgi:hypothetical protein